MNSSENLNELAPALAKAQAVMTGALKDSSNPFFKSRYADLESVWTSCRKALTDNGLSVVQYGSFRATVENVAVFPTIITRLLHSSGQWIEGETAIRAKDDGPQAQGSGITYARRYGLAAMVGVYQTDDDAEAAQGRQPQVQSATPETSMAEHAESYASAFRACLKSGNDLGVFQTNLDLHAEGKAVYTAVWRLLHESDRVAIKAIIAAHKEPEKVTF